MTDLILKDAASGVVIGQFDDADELLKALGTTPGLAVEGFYEAFGRTFIVDCSGRQIRALLDDIDRYASTTDPQRIRDENDEARRLDAVANNCWSRWDRGLVSDEEYLKAKRAAEHYRHSLEAHRARHGASSPVRTLEVR